MPMNSSSGKALPLVDTVIDEWLPDLVFELRAL